jgi:hypothetical protein
LLCRTLWSGFELRFIHFVCMWVFNDLSFCLTAKIHQHHVFSFQFVFRPNIFRGTLNLTFVIDWSFLVFYVSNSSFNFYPLNDHSYINAHVTDYWVARHYIAYVGYKNVFACLMVGGIYMCLKGCEHSFIKCKQSLNLIDTFQRVLRWYDTYGCW